MSRGVLYLSFTIGTEKQASNAIIARHLRPGAGLEQEPARLKSPPGARRGACRHLEHVAEGEWVSVSECE